MMIISYGAQKVGDGVCKSLGYSLWGAVLGWLHGVGLDVRALPNSVITPLPEKNVHNPKGTQKSISLPEN